MACPHREGKRLGVQGLSRLLWGAVSLLAWAGMPVAQAAPPDAGLPQRNLLIEWRMSGQGQTHRGEQGLRTGQIILDSRGGVIGRTDIGMGRVQTESQTDSVQQVQVLNGGRARLFVGRSQSYTVWQWAFSTMAGSSLGGFGPQTGNGGGSSITNNSGGTQTGRYSPQALAQTAWIDLGDGLNVRPRWPGGRAPVLVELEAQSRQPASAGGAYSGQMDPDGQTRRIEVGSTLSVPLGDWVVVARSGTQVQRQQAGSLSTRDLDDNQSARLEIRVTAP